MTDARPDEIKPSFSGKYFVFTASVALITGALGFVSNYLYELVTSEEKVIDVFSTTTGNLAEIPTGIENSLEINLSVTPTRKEPVKSLFRYEVTILNNSNNGVENFSIFLKSPPGVLIAGNPTIISQPTGLVNAIKIEDIDKGVDYEKKLISLLNPTQSLTFTYYGFSKQRVDAKALDVIVQKKDWQQNNVSELDDSERKSFLLQFFDKKVIDFTGRDVMAAMIVSVMFLFAAVIYGGFLILFFIRRRRH